MFIINVKYLINIKKDRGHSDSRSNNYDINYLFYNLDKITFEMLDLIIFLKFYYF